MVSSTVWSNLRSADGSPCGVSYWERIAPPPSETSITTMTSIRIEPMTGLTPRVVGAVCVRGCCFIGVCLLWGRLGVW